MLIQICKTSTIKLVGLRGAENHRVLVNENTISFELKKQSRSTFTVFPFLFLFDFTSYKTRKKILF